LNILPIRTQPTEMPRNVAYQTDRLESGENLASPCHHKVVISIFQLHGRAPRAAPKRFGSSLSECIGIRHSSISLGSVPWQAYSRPFWTDIVRMPEMIKLSC
jgi:hypothetical protein